MMGKNEKNICFYSAVLITLIVNSARLIALRENAIIVRYWQFDVLEYLFQFSYNLLFCWSLFYLNLVDGKFLSLYRQNDHLRKYWTYNGILVILMTLVGNRIQYFVFADNHVPGMLGRGYIARFLFSTILIAIIVRIILLTRESKRKDMINEQLKTAYYQSQLQLLKEQMNPHLLFNSLSSLSGIVRENPTLAQVYILHLSKVLRNALTRSGNTLVTVSEELDTLQSYEQLLRMRLEHAFVLIVQVTPSILQTRIPHLSLQPLLENASKHNSATTEKPLTVRIFDEKDWLVVTNNLQQIDGPENSTGIGLANLNERFRLLVHREIVIEKTQDLFVVKLPIRL